MTDEARAAGRFAEQLQALTSSLSGALERDEVVRVMVGIGRAAMGAAGGTAWMLRDRETLEIAGHRHAGVANRVGKFGTIALADKLPECDVVTSGQLRVFGSTAELLAAYPAAVPIPPYQAWAVIPCLAAGEVVGAVSFAYDHERVFSEEDRVRLLALTSQASIALDRCRRIEGERRARKRESQLGMIAAKLSSALTPPQVAELTSNELLSAVSADIVVTVLREGDVVRVLGSDGPRDPESRVKLDVMPLAMAMPVADAVRTARFIWCATQGEMVTRYPLLKEVVARNGMRSLAVVPFSFEGTTIGALGVSWREERVLAAGEQEFLQAVAQLAASALERARLFQEVSELNARKDEFLAMLGHELRNPLAPITTALELMALRSPDAVPKEREVIRRQVVHMTRLVDELLDVSRITRGKIELAREVLELGRVIANAIETAHPLLDKRRQELAVDVPERGLVVDGDPERLAQVFQNLLTNASKYSEQGTRITLRAKVAGDRVVIEVADEGVGITPQLLPRLFEPFVQGARALDRSQGGLGIGLTLARSLLELHGGTIVAASAGAGKGSTFTVTLPRVHASVAEVPPARRTKAVAAGRRVLVVDDNVDAAQTLHELIAALGHQAAVAHDGAAALVLVETFKPDIAVLDIGLPVMDGYELARRLRAQVPPVRLIALTGYGQDHDRARVHAAGFDHHLVKPIAVDTLMPLLDPE